MKSHRYCQNSSIGKMKDFIVVIFDLLHIHFIPLTIILEKDEY